MKNKILELTSNIKYTGCKELKLLVVDDDALLLKFFKIHFSQYFAETFVATNAEKALDALDLYDIDIVLTEYDIPGQNGLWLLSQIKEYYSSVVVLMISKMSLPETAKTTVMRQTAGWLRKPFEMEDIHSLIMAGAEEHRKQAQKKIKKMTANKKKRA